jgi:hypothetical protein
MLSKFQSTDRSLEAHGNRVMLKQPARNSWMWPPMAQHKTGLTAHGRVTPVTLRQRTSDTVRQSEPT